MGSNSMAVQSTAIQEKEKIFFIESDPPNKSIRGLILCTTMLVCYFATVIDRTAPYGPDVRR
jgi:hypothetical protein